MPSLALVRNLNDGQYPQTVHLSPSSVTLVMTGLTFLEQLWRWQGDSGYELDPTEVDEVENMTAKLAKEMMMSFVGQVISVATDCPSWALECDGATYAKSDYPALYDALDSVFHVDSATFRVPDFQGQTEIGLGTSPNAYVYTMDDGGGFEVITLTTAEIPSHSHADAGHTHAEGVAAPSVALVGAIPSAVPAIGVTGTGFANIQNTGGDGAHENRQPYRALRKVIVAF